MKIIQRSSIETHTEFFLMFDYIGKDGAGLMFPCDKDGKVGTLPRCAQENYQECLGGTHKVHKPYIVTIEHAHRIPSIGKCECGAEVMLDRWTNPCQCGIDYNAAGQALAPREQWGEETGESFHDCL